MKIYLLQHVHELDCESEDVKNIGIYSSESLAKKAINRLSSKPGFMSIPDGFIVVEYDMNKDHWTEGYVTSD